MLEPGAALQPNLPLSRHPFVHTRSLDEARGLYSSTTTPVRAEKSDRATPFEWRANLAAMGPLVISTSAFGCGLRVSSASSLDRFVLSLAVTGRAEYTVADGSFTVARDQAGALGSPSMSPDFQMEAGFHCVEVAIQRAALEEALAALTGEPAREPLRFEPRISVASGAGASALSFVGFLMDELDREDGALGSALVSGRLVEAFLLSLLTGQPHSHSTRVRQEPPAGGRHYIRQIEEYLEANADRPVTLADLTALTGVGARSIQEGFRAHRGCTPMEFLRARRLRLARRRLLSASGSTVAAIALECGFEHLGRFSVSYRAEFGESPRDTLRRALRAHAG